ncbi:hypothetical protein EVAR_75896_1 [Eumeta japonica]|uniref:Uncharacterized protein n=1 Tax=Eumeta variegata TaxID=151549 RepID=A0A4C1UW62_EUMVA|nr:hypothetical protein EVAR_75896_1 [Eumeta japonica]
MKVGLMQWRCDRCVVCGVARKDKSRNSDVRERCGLKEDVVIRAEKGMLRWFGHLERMNESRLTKQIYRGNLCDGKNNFAKETIVIEVVVSEKNISERKHGIVLEQLMRRYCVGARPLTRPHSRWHLA